MKTGFWIWQRSWLVALLGFAVLLHEATAALQPVSLRSSILAPPAGGNGDSLSPILSADGRYVLFASTANNLTLTATNNPPSVLSPARLNVFLRDRTNGTTTLVSVNITGTSGTNGNYLPTGISTNGRYALFESSTDNLASNILNNASDVFIRDLVGGTTALVSTTTNGVSGNGSSRNSVMTPDGRYVAFVSAATNLVAGDANKIPDVFVRDLIGGTTTLVSVGATTTNASLSAGSSESPAITPDGRYVAFYSTTTNLVPGLNLTGEIYVRDLVGGTTTWASTNARIIYKSIVGTSNAVSYNQKISDDGQFVAFQVSSNPPSSSLARGVILRYSLQTGLADIVHSNAYVPWGAFEDIRSLDMTPDGRFIAFVANGNGSALTNSAIYLWDAQAGTNTLVSADLSGALPATGICDSPSVDPSGRYVAFLSSMTNLTTNVLVGEFHLYVRDVQNGTTRLLDADTNGVGTGVNPTTVISLSANGQSAAFECADGNLVANDRNRDYDVFVRNLATDATELISIRDPAMPTQTPNGSSTLYLSCVSTNGRYVVFASDASDVVPNDTNGYRDVFVRDLVTGTNILVSADTNGLPGAGQSFEPAISGDGRYVVFTSWASNLVAGDTNNSMDVFVRDLQSNKTTLVSVSTNGVDVGTADSRAPLISSDGRYVLIQSFAKNLAPAAFYQNENLFLRDLVTATNYAITTMGDTGGFMSANGRYVAVQESETRTYVWDRLLLARIYTNSTFSALKAISPNGQYVAFTTTGSPYGWLNVTDWALNTNWAITTGPIYSSDLGRLGFTPDGRLLAYSSGATNAPNDSNGATDIYLYDFQTGSNLLVSRSFNSTNTPNGDSRAPAISLDGRFVAYRSSASNCVPGDTNGVPDLFVYDGSSGANTLATPNQSGTATANNRSIASFFSGDGKTLVLQSWASDLVAQDFNRSGDIFAMNVVPAVTPDPTNAAAVLEPEIFFGVIPGLGSGSSTPGPVLVWPAIPGISYRVQFKNDLNDPIWQDLNGSVTLIGPNGYAVDFTPTTEKRFYRFILSN